MQVQRVTKSMTITAYSNALIDVPTITGCTPVGIVAAGTYHPSENSLISYALSNGKADIWVGNRFGYSSSTVVFADVLYLPQ